MRALRGRLIDCTGDPYREGSSAVRDIADGLLLVEDGLIQARGTYAELAAELPPDTAIEDHRGRLILPGFIDTHVHYPQHRMTASYGAQLLDWLERYTFPMERRFADADYAGAEARLFLDDLFRNGTTSAVVYATVHEASAEAFFAAAAPTGARMLCGKLLMDEGPEGLRDDVAGGIAATERLIARWHGRGRLGCIVSPRFAVTSSEAQLQAAGELLARHPGVWLQTHLAENLEEIRSVAARFPWARDYTEVYERAGLLGPRSLFGHCIHLAPRERRALAETGSVAVLCPTSNLFIGSGLVDLAALREADPPVRMALATDVGGGTSLSMLATAAAAYTIHQLRGLSWHPFEALYAMTLGNAQALGLESEIGTLEPGSAADLVVLDPLATPTLATRLEGVDDLAELLFAFVILGDERAAAATFVAGEPVHPLR